MPPNPDSKPTRFSQEKTVLIMMFAFLSLLAAQLPQLTWQSLRARLHAPDTMYVLNFWSTWCRPCITELPHLQKAADSLQKHYPIRFYLISLDFPPEGPNLAEKLLRQKSITLPAFWLHESDPNQWIPQVSTDWDGSIPFTLLWPNRQSKQGTFENDSEALRFVLEGYANLTRK